MTKSKSRHKGGKKKSNAGRPSKYSDELANDICARIANGESLVKICNGDKYPAATTIFQWIANNDEFRNKYAHAREAQADKLADEIVSIADDGVNDTYITDGGQAVNHDVIARSRLRVDARKWVASKLAPKKYGDKITQEHTGVDGGAIKTETVTKLDYSKLSKVQLETLLAIEASQSE